MVVWWRCVHGGRRHLSLQTAACGDLSAAWASLLAALGTFGGVRTLGGLVFRSCRRHCERRISATRAVGAPRVRGVLGSSASCATVAAVGRVRETITAAQDLYLRLIGASGQWNAFNGPAIEDSLRANCGLWRAALLTSEVSGMRSEKPPRLRDTVDLVVLRDLPKNAVTLSTLFLLAEPGKQDSLEALAKGKRMRFTGSIRMRRLPQWARVPCATRTIWPIRGALSFVSGGTERQVTEIRRSSAAVGGPRIVRR